MIRTHSKAIIHQIHRDKHSREAEGQRLRAIPSHLNREKRIISGEQLPDRIMTRGGHIRKTFFDHPHQLVIERGLF